MPTTCPQNVPVSAAYPPDVMTCKRSDVGVGCKGSAFSVGWNFGPEKLGLKTEIDDCNVIEVGGSDEVVMVDKLMLNVETLDKCAFDSDEEKFDNSKSENVDKLAIKDVIDDSHFEHELAVADDVGEKDNGVIDGGSSKLKRCLQKLILCAKETTITTEEESHIHSPDADFSGDVWNSGACGPYTDYGDVVVDVNKPEGSAGPLIRHCLVFDEVQLKKSCRPEKSPVFNYLLSIIFIILVIRSDSFDKSDTRAVALNYAIFLIFLDGLAPKRCGLHGDQKTAHGRSSDSGAEHGRPARADNGGAQGTVPPIVGGGDGSGGGDQGGDGDGNKGPSEPQPNDQIADVPESGLRHGDFEDVSQDIQVVLADGAGSAKILAEMDKCLNCCCLHDEGRCPSMFCNRLVSSIRHFQEKLGCCSCSICQLVEALVIFHLKMGADDKTTFTVTGEDIVAFVREWFPLYAVRDVEASDEHARAKPDYRGKNKASKFADEASDPSQLVARFDIPENNVAISGFVADGFAGEGHAPPIGGAPGEEVALTSSSSSTGDAVSKVGEHESDLAGTSSDLDTVASNLGAISIDSNAAGSLPTRQVAGAFMQPTAMTSDSRYLLNNFYEDEIPRPAPQVLTPRKQKLSLPAFVNRKERRVVPVRAGHVGIGGPHELERACDRWELLRDTEYRAWRQEVQREAEGVFLDGESVEEHAIAVDGHYDENIHWTTLEMVGEGCFGKVYTCQDEITRALFCIKMVTLEKFDVAEIKAWCRLSHNGFCELRGVIRRGMSVLIFMPYVGEDLHEYLEEQQLRELPGCRAERLPLRSALDFLLQLLDALFVMEQRGVIHNDLKSANILVDEMGQLKIIDFGLAHIIPHGRLMQVHHAMGTPIICSPERMRSQAYGFTADVWSIICILREMLTGHYMWFPKFQDATNFTLTFKIGDLQNPPMEFIPGSLNLPERVLDIFRHGWCIDQTHRPHALELSNMVKEICHDLDTGTLTYEEPCALEIEETPPVVPQMQPEDVQVPPPLFLEDPTSTDPEQVALPLKILMPGANAAEGAVGGAEPWEHGDSIFINIQPASLERKMDTEAAGICPNFSDTNTSNRLMVHSVSLSASNDDGVNRPVLSILNQTESSDSFSVPVTQFTPQNMRSSDLGSSMQPSMELEIHRMHSTGTSGIVNDHDSTSSYCPPSTMTDTSVRTVLESAAKGANEEVTVYPVSNDRTVPAPELSSPEDQSMPFDSRSKGTSSSSDEMYQRLQQDLVLQHVVRKVSMDASLPLGEELVDYHPSTSANRSPETPSGSGFSYRSNDSDTSGMRQRLDVSRFLTNNGEANMDTAPTITFHENHPGGPTVVAFTCSQGYRRQQIREVIETVAGRLKRVVQNSTGRFTVYDVEGNNLHLDSTVDKILPAEGREIHLVVTEAPEDASWYFDDGIHTTSIY